MAGLDIAENYFIKTADTSEEVKLGSFQTSESSELAYIRLYFYKHGTEGGTETMQLNIYGDDDFGTPVYQSNTISVSNIDGISTYWIGWIRFDFDRENISKELTYHATVSISNYTRDASNFYFGFALDWPEATNQVNRAAKMEIFGYK